MGCLLDEGMPALRSFVGGVLVCLCACVGVLGSGSVSVPAFVSVFVPIDRQTDRQTDRHRNRADRDGHAESRQAVSYTHLTLPTICSV
eukprot:8393751-Alexandrium_andersonii.AAC.1